MLFPKYGKNIIIAAILTVAITHNTGFAGEDDPASKTGDNVQGIVLINAAKQQTTGIQTLTLSPVQHQAEYEAMGKVITIQPLLALRERYLTAQAELNSAKARQQLAAVHLHRQQELYKNGVVPKRSLMDQETQGISEQAAVAASQAKVMAIANEALVNWGKTLADWALSKKSRALEAFVLGKQQLLQITLPVNKVALVGKATIMIAATGDRTGAQPAVLVSSATLVDNTRQGLSYFFKTAAPDLTIGMKVTAWLAEDSNRQTGFLIPESALIWYLGQVYVYTKAGTDAFSRRLLSHFIAVPGGYFITEGLASGDEIVITGGQMLLSEELKQQIPDED